MNKIPTMFVRDPDDRSRVIPEIHPECQWVRDGEGVCTRKYEGTSVLLDNKTQWWARREVKKGKKVPENYMYLSTDPISEAQMGYEPIEQSSFAKMHKEVLERRAGHVWMPGTYELMGPKINQNPEKLEHHDMQKHSDAEVYLNEERPRTFESITKLVLHVGEWAGWEGIVYHHPDGRMAKLKYRDLKFMR